MYLAGLVHRVSGVVLLAVLVALAGVTVHSPGSPINEFKRLSQIKAFSIVVVAVGFVVVALSAYGVYLKILRRVFDENYLMARFMQK